MIRKLEELSMNAWPSLQTKLYDGWVLRFSDGYTRRANSVSPIYESTISLDKKIDFCEKEYRSQNLPTLFKLVTESNPKGIDARLEERGYTKINETSLRIIDLKQYKIQDLKNVIVNLEPNDEWLNAFFCCSNILDKQTQLTAKKILNNIFGPVIYVAKEINGRIVGCGYGAIEGEYIGIFDVVVHEDFRENGYGKDIINGILGTALKKNVINAYLQVTVGNTPAEKLYEKIGFKEVYKYWYRILQK
jgi:ribosomal protein S18 acetylase RimI-like enzyme